MTKRTRNVIAESDDEDTNEEEKDVTLFSDELETIYEGKFDEESEEEEKSEKRKKVVNEDVETKEEPKENPWLIFCFGESGVITGRICPGFANVLDSVTGDVTYCISSTCTKHVRATPESPCFLQIPFPVTTFDTWFFSQCGTLGKYKQFFTDETYGYLPVDFNNVFKLFQFFGVSSDIQKQVKNAIDRSAKFYSSVTALSGYVISRKIQCHVEHPTTIMYLEGFSLLDRLEFMVKHNLGHIYWGTMVIEKAKVAELLSIKEEWLNVLNQDYCVLAGNSCIKIGCPWVKFTPNFAVTFYILKTPKQMEIMAHLCNVLEQSNYKLFQHGPSIVALNTWNRRRIHIVPSEREQAADLSKHMTLHTNQSIYNGKVLQATCYAHYDWITKTCGNGDDTTKDINSLLSMKLLGFKLSPSACCCIDRALDYNTTEREDQVKHNYPFFVPTKCVPNKIQYANLLVSYNYRYLKDGMKSYVPL